MAGSLRFCDRNRPDSDSAQLLAWSEPRAAVPLFFSVPNGSTLSRDRISTRPRRRLQRGSADSTDRPPGVANKLDGRLENGCQPRPLPFGLDGNGWRSGIARSNRRCRSAEKRRPVDNCLRFVGSTEPLAVAAREDDSPWVTQTRSQSAKHRGQYVRTIQ